MVAGAYYSTRLIFPAHYLLYVALLFAAITASILINKTGQRWLRAHERPAFYDWAAQGDFPNHTPAWSRDRRDQTLAASHTVALRSLENALVERPERVLSLFDEKQERAARAALGYPTVVPFRRSRDARVCPDRPTTGDDTGRAA